MLDTFHTHCLRRKESSLGKGDAWKQDMYLSINSVSSPPASQKSIYYSNLSFCLYQNSSVSSWPALAWMSVSHYGGVGGGGGGVDDDGVVRLPGEAQHNRVSG